MWRRIISYLEDKIDKCIEKSLNKQEERMMRNDDN